MDDTRTLFHTTNGGTASGYTLELHSFTSGNAMADYSSSTPIVTYTDNADGTYSADIDTTESIVWILKNSAGTIIKKRPIANDQYEMLIGDDTPLIGD